MKVGFTCSSFDLLHAGHILMLKEAKEACDYLIIGLQTDVDTRSNKNKCIQSVTERYLQLRAVKYIDEIIPYRTEDELYNLLLMISPDVRIIGEEYRDKEFTGRNIESIEIYYNSRKHNLSTTNLRKQICK